MILRSIFICILICFSFNSNVNAQIEKRTYETKMVLSEKPDIDGNLNETIWITNDWEDGFIQYEPLNGKKPQCETKYILLYDESNIYLAVKSLDPEPENITARIARKDSWEGDLIEIHFDSYMDNRTSFIFSINAAGSIGDKIIFDDGMAEDLNWNPVWEGKTSITDDGWIAEMRIPLSQLRFDKQIDQTWGFQVIRWVHRLQEFSTWQPVSKDQPGWASTFGILKGINNISSFKRIEIIPYFSSKGLSLNSLKNNPISSDKDIDFLSGIDLKIGVTNNFNFDLTLNPDFGQTEADPSEINLTAFETFFSEKRSFFVEGTSIFHFRLQEFPGGIWSDKLFHSRRIGSRPSFNPAGMGDYVKEPTTTTILGAAKLTGKTQSGLSIGVFESVTSNESAELLTDNRTSKIKTEPLTNYFASRVQKDWDDGQMTLGSMLTAVNRNIENQHLNFMNRSAYTAGLDFSKMWSEKSYRFIFKSYASRISGDKEAITAAQTSSTRYYQRPGQDHLDFNPDRTSLTGHGGIAAFEKMQKGHFYGNATFIWRTPGLELNDIGFLRFSDFLFYNLEAHYREWNPFSIFNRYDILTSLWNGYTFGKEKVMGGISNGFDAQLKNFWNVNMYHNYEFGKFDLSVLRGGPAVLLPGVRRLGAGISSDLRKNMVFNFNLHRTFGKYNYYKAASLSGGLRWNPNHSIFMSFNPGFEKSFLDHQYIGQYNGENTKKYLLGEIDRKTFYLINRINYNLTPDLSIQYYGMPFIASGSYSKFKHLKEADSPDYSNRYRQLNDDEISYDKDTNKFSIDRNRDNVREFQFVNPDFNFFQFRSNLVVRWEFDPGSVLFLVWTQDRTNNMPHGTFKLRENMNSLFEIEPDNVFLIKISKWFSL